jgi:hypothetical protein
MNSTLTVEEINARYPNEWVLLGEPKTDRSLNVLSGLVLWHSVDREEVYQKAAELHPKRSAFLFTGDAAVGREFLFATA